MYGRREWLFFAALPVLVGLCLQLVRVETDLSAFFVTGDSTEEALLANQMQSGELSRRYLISVACTADNNAEFTSSFLPALIEIDGVKRVWIPGRQEGLIDTLISLYLPHYAQIFSLQPEAEAAALFTQKEIEKRAALLKQALVSPQRQTVKKIALGDPMLLTLNGFQPLLRQRAERSQETGCFENLVLETRPSGLDYPAQTRIQAAIQELFDRTNQTFNGSHTLEMTGIPIFAVATEALMKNDIQRVSILSTTALTLLFLWLFRSLGALFRVSLILIAAIGSAVLMTNLVFGYVHGLTMAFGTTLIGVCIDYPIHAMVHASASGQETRMATVARIWPSLLLGGATTLVGYTSLGLSGYPGFQQIVVYAGSGILVSLFLTRWVLPGLIPREARGLTPRLQTQRWLLLCNRYRSLFVLVVAVTAVAALIGLSRLQWVDDLETLAPELAELKERDRAIRSRMASVEPGRFILVSGNDVESALQRAEQVYASLESLKAEGELGNYFGLYPWILSEQLQRRNEGALASQLTPEHIRGWRDALRTEGLSVERLSRIEVPETEPLRLEAVLASPVGQLIESQITVTEDTVLLVIWLATHSPEAIRKTLEGIDGAQYFSQRDLLNRLAATYRERAVSMLGVGLAVIILLLLWRYQRIAQVVRTLLPALLAGLFILGGLAISGYPLSFLHLIGFLLAVAICVDYGIFFLENRAQNHRLTYQAMGASMLTSAVAFASLSAASNGSLKALSVTVALGVVIGFLMCPVVIKPSLD